MSLEHVATVVLGLHAAADLLDPVNELIRQEAGNPVSEELEGRALVDFLRDKGIEGRRWWETRIDHLAGFLDSQLPVPAEYSPWIHEQSDHTLLGLRDEGVAWAGPLTIAVGRLALERLEQIRLDAAAIERHWTAYHVNDPDRAFSDGPSRRPV